MAENIQLAADVQTLEVEPGQEIETTISVQNLGVAVGVFAIEIEGLEPSWYRLSSNNVSLFPGDQTTATLTVLPPRLGTSLAGTYDFQCKVSSQKEDEEEQSIQLSLVIKPFYEFLIDYSPQRARGASVVHTLSITNSGNSELGFDLSGRDADELCQFSFEAESPVVAPNATLEVPVVVRGKRPLRGAPVQYQYEVTATPVDGKAEPSSRPGFLEVPARIPTWVFRAATLAAVAVVLGIAIWYFVFFEPKESVDVFTVNPRSVVLTVGESSDLTTIMADKGGNVLEGRLVSWSSNDLSVAKVDDSGSVEAVAPGPAVITAELQNEDLDPKTVTVEVLPSFVSAECREYDPQALRYEISDAKLVITDGSKVVMTLTPEYSKVGQEDAMKFAENHVTRCFIGKDLGTDEVLSADVEFWVGPSGFKFDELEESKCFRFIESEDSLQLREKAPGVWTVTMGDSPSIEFDNPEDAQAAKIFAERYSERCFVDYKTSETDQVSYAAQFWK